MIDLRGALNEKEAEVKEARNEKMMVQKKVKDLELKIKLSLVDCNLQSIMKISLWTS